MFFNQIENYIKNNIYIGKWTKSIIKILYKEQYKTKSEEKKKSWFIGWLFKSQDLINENEQKKIMEFFEGNQIKYV